MLLRTTTILLMASALSSPASARSHHSGLHPDCNIRFPCEVPSLSEGRRRVIFALDVQSRGWGQKNEPSPLSGAGAALSSVVAHPHGCPRRAFCGCGAAVRIFGAPVRALWLAANWFRFPRAAPAPGMAAVRRHHVFVLEQHIGGSVWQVYDANSGRHRTQVHPRSIAGYTIVNPRS